MQKRGEFKLRSTLAEHLADDTKRLHEQARALKPGADLDHVLKQIG
jgi:hypothetical protein